MHAKVKAAAQPALRASTVPLVKKSPCLVLEVHTRRPTQVRVLLAPTSITARQPEFTEPAQTGIPRLRVVQSALCVNLGTTASREPNMPARTTNTRLKAGLGALQQSLATTRTLIRHLSAPYAMRGTTQTLELAISARFALKDTTAQQMALGSTPLRMGVVRHTTVPKAQAT